MTITKLFFIRNCSYFSFFPKLIETPLINGKKENRSKNQLTCTSIRILKVCCIGTAIFVPCYIETVAMQVPC